VHIAQAVHGIAADHRDQGGRPARGPAPRAGGGPAPGGGGGGRVLVRYITAMAVASQTVPPTR
jgi:hypothetical protein